MKRDCTQNNDLSVYYFSESQKNFIYKSLNLFLLEKDVIKALSSVLTLQSWSSILSTNMLHCTVGDIIVSYVMNMSSVYHLIYPFNQTHIDKDVHTSMVDNSAPFDWKATISNKPSNIPYYSCEIAIYKKHNIRLLSMHTFLSSFGRENLDNPVRFFVLH